MFRRKILLLLFFQANLFCSPFNIAVIGLGGRAQGLLRECLKVNPKVCVVAVCDDNAQASFKYHLDKLKIASDPLAPIYEHAFENTSLYPNTPDGLERLFKEHVHSIDKILITSANYDHLRHLKTVINECSNKKIFMEKPLFRTLDEFEEFEELDFDRAKGNSITIGLTLRYSSMARICAKQLQSHQKKLGTLRKVKAWEYLNFRHALTAFIMGWRRYINLSGGFLLEKSIHDLDLELFFINELGIDPIKIDISTEAANKFFIKSRKNELLEHIMNNEGFRRKAEQSKSRPWEPFNFIRNKQGAIDWKNSIDAIFSEYPDNDDFTNLNIIPDYHRLRARLYRRDKSTVDMELEVDAGGFRSETKRGQRFIFDNGQVLIDIMASKMVIKYSDGKSYEYELYTNNNDHADGDEHIIRTILGEDLPAGYHMATLEDPVVLLANKMALVSEKQIFHKNKKVSLQKKDKKWVVVPHTKGN